MKAKRWIALLIALAMMLSITACSSSTDDTSDDDSTSTTEESTEDTTEAEEETDDDSTEAEATSTKTDLIVGWTYSVEDFEPAFSNNAIGFALVYETLFDLNPVTGELEGRLVESYEWIDDTHLQLTLKEGITFSNGDALTPSDVLWSFQYYIDAGSNLATYFDNYDFDNCEIIDDYTFILAYYEPYGPALNYLTIMRIQNQSYYEEYGEDAYWDSPCGTGPYEVVENISGSHTSYQLRDDYWDTENIPEAETITVKSYSDASTMYIDFENGALDVAWGLTASDAERAAETDGEGYTLVTQSELDVKMFCLNYSKEEYQSDEVRQAIAIGVDWAAVGETAYGYLYREATSTLPEGCNYKIDTDGYEYDLDAALELLEEAGYSDGFTIDLVIVQNDTNQSMAESIQYYLGLLGITLNIESYEMATAIPMFMAGETEALIKTANGGAYCLEPDQIYDTMKASSTNTSIATADEIFDSYLMDGLTTVDEAEREENYVAAQEWLYESCWAIPICEDDVAYVQVDGVTIHTINMMYPDLRYTELG